MVKCPAATPPPQVSVLMAVYNGERYLEEALRSMMDQTLRDIEIIVVDDGSFDGTGDILSRLSAEDARIRVIRSESNIGPYPAANLGLEAVRAPLVARMDADDISMPERLAVQKAFLDTNPEVTLVGASTEWMDDTGRTFLRDLLCHDSTAVRWMARFGSPIPHPTFMFRRHAPDGTSLRYDTSFFCAQDYDFICRLLARGLHAACVPDVLLRYRWHDSQISSTREEEQQTRALEISTRFNRETLPAAAADALAEMWHMDAGETKATPRRIARLFAGTRVMLAHDAAHYPGRRAWLRRQTAGKLKKTLRLGGASSSTIKRAFLRHAPDLLISLKLRKLETRGRLPAWLCANPPLPIRSDGQGASGAAGKPPFPPRPRMATAPLPAARDHEAR